MENGSNEKKQEQPTPGPQPQCIKFNEDKIAGDGFTQLDPETGWLWIGLNVRKFTFRDAWAFIKSQEFQLSRVFTTMEQEAFRRAQLAPTPGPKPSALSRIFKN